MSVPAVISKTPLQAQRSVASDDWTRDFLLRVAIHETSHILGRPDSYHPEVVERAGRLYAFAITKINW